MAYTQLHTPTTLGELAVKYRNADFIADLVSPVTPIERKRATFWTFDRRDAHRLTDSRMAPDGLPNRRSFNATSSTVEVEPYGLHDTIPVSDLNDPEPGIDLEADTVEDLTQDLLLGREKRVADLTTAVGSYASSNRVTLGTPWTNAASTPIADIQTGQRACAVRPNVAFCDEVSFDALARHPDIISTLRGTSGVVERGLATATQIAAYFGLEAIWVGRCKFNSANPSAAGTYSYVWPQGVFVLAKIVAQPRAKEVTLCRTYRKRSDGLTMKVTRVMQEEPGTEGSLFVKVTMEEVVGMVASDVGYRIGGAA